MSLLRSSTTSSPLRPSSNQGFCAKKRSPQNFWLWKLLGLWLRKMECYWCPRQFLLSAPNYSIQTHLLCTGAVAGKTPGIYRGVLNCLASWWDLLGQLSPQQNCWQRPFSFLRPTPHRALMQAPFTSNGSHYWPIPGDSLRPYPTQLLSPTEQFPVAFTNKQTV